MSRRVWEAVMRSNFFYVRIYRRSTAVLFFSSLLNLALIIVIWMIHQHQARPNFYATNGATPPIPLTALLQPNESSTPLLSSDPIGEKQVKLIPQ